MTEYPYRKRAAEFNKKMGLAEPDEYWEDALVRFSVIGEETGELLGAVNKDRDVGEELADVVITLYTGADTLDINLPEGPRDVDELMDFRFEDEEREAACLIYAYTRDILLGIVMQDEDQTRVAMKKTLYYCHMFADLKGIDLESEFNAKMDYNMQKSGVKVNGKPVDDVEDGDE